MRVFNNPYGQRIFLYPEKQNRKKSKSGSINMGPIKLKYSAFLMHFYICM